MLVRQDKSTFIRCYDGIGYVTNQLTRYDRTYNETGADFLNCITRNPKEISVIIDALSLMYGNSVSYAKLKHDFNAFIQDLEKCCFVVTGDTPKECDAKDIGFSYSLGDMKTKVRSFDQDVDGVDNTYDYLIEADQRKPHLKSIQFEITSRCN